MVRRGALVLVALVLSLSASAQQFNLSDHLPQDPDVKTGTLPNGMRYYVKKNAKPEHRMELRLALKAGSILEDDDQQGLAHFCEHMQFNGLKHFPKSDLVNFLEATGVRFGAHLNASTSFDQTIYMLQLPTDSARIVDKGLQVLVDWAGGATLDSDEIDKERGVVLEEWRLGRGAQERVRKEFIPVEYAGSHYAERMPIGKPEIIEHALYSALRRYYHTWYRPDLMAVIAVGDFDPDQMVKELTTRFGAIPASTERRERTKYDVPLHTDLRAIVASDKELQGNLAEILFQRKEESEQTVGDYRASMVRAMYVGMLNSRLQELTRKSSAPFLFSGANDGRDLGGISEFGLIVALKPDNITGGMRAGLEELVRVRDHGFTASELERQKKEMMRSYEQAYKERDKTDSRRVLGDYISNFLRDDPFPGTAYEYELAKHFIPTISLEEVNTLTAPLITNAGPVVLLGCQKNEKTQIPSNDDVRSLFESTWREKVAAYEDKTTNQPLLPTKPKAGAVTKERTIADLGLTEWKLSNGATVVVKPTDFKNDEILFSAIAPGGTSLASDADAHSANFAAGVIDESGLGAFDATALEKALAGKVANVSPSIGELTEGFRGNAAPQDLETMLQLLYLYATAPRADEDAFKSQIQKTEAFLKTRGAAPESAFSDTLTATLTQYAPRYRPLTEESLKEISLEKIKQFYHDRYADFSNFTFFIVGNVDLKSLKPLVEQYVASLPSTGRMENWRDLGVRPPTGVVTKSVYKGVEPKSRVSISVTSPFDYTPKNRFVLQEMSEILGIKLRETLREEKGGVYGVGVQGVPTHYPQSRCQLVISFGCAPDRVDELVGAVMAKLDTMTMKAPEEIYLKKVTEIAKKELEVNRKQNNYWLSAMQQAYFNRESVSSFFTERESYINGLTTNDILEAGKKYCAKNNLIKVVLYPETKQ